MSNRLYQLLKQIGVFIVVAILVFAGCGMQNGANPLSTDNAAITTDGENDPGVLTKGNVNDRGKAKAVGGGITNRTTKTRNISASLGGEIHVKSESGTYDYYLYVPPGALGKDTDITMAVVSQDEAMIDLGPDGLWFLKPVTLRMGIKPELKKQGIQGKIGIYWYNPDSEKWEYQDGTAHMNEEGKIVAETALHHFSRYALGGDSSFINKLNYEYVPGYDNSFNYGEYLYYYY